MKTLMSSKIGGLRADIGRGLCACLALVALAGVALAPASTFASRYVGVQPIRPAALLSSGGVLYVADTTRNQILARLNNGRFVVIAGRGVRGFSGDGGKATSARLDDPQGMVMSAEGTLYFSDSGNNRVRAVTRDGDISTVAGNGGFGWSPNGVIATRSPLGDPTALALSSDGSRLIAATGANEIVRLTKAGRFLEVAGSRTEGGLTGVGHPAAAASVDGPNGLAYTRLGLYVSGSDTKTLLLIDRNGRLRAPAGKDGFYPGGASPFAQVRGNLYAMNDQRIEIIRPSGLRTVLTFSGRRIGGVTAFQPNGIAVSANGSLYLDSYAGNGVVNRSAILSVDSHLRIHLLWAA